MQDNTLVSLLGSNRVVMTAHQAFFTSEAINKIISATIENIDNYSSGLRGEDPPNSILILAVFARLNCKMPSVSHMFVPNREA
jgi:hypothetical protein